MERIDYRQLKTLSDVKAARARVDAQLERAEGRLKEDYRQAARLFDFDYLVDVIDWELNVDPEFRKHRFMSPRPVRPEAEMLDAGYRDVWVCYKSKGFSAKELTILPGRSAVIRDNAAYGMIMMQGHGTMGVWNVETPALIRYGEKTCDEFFVSEEAARRGVRIVNESKCEPLVMLKHFGPGNPDLVLD